MAQFDVYRNSGKHRDVIPFVVAVQSSLYDDNDRRVVVPLVRTSALGTLASPGLNPTFKIKNISVVLHPLETLTDTDTISSGCKTTEMFLILNVGFNPGLASVPSAEVLTRGTTTRRS